MINPTIYSAISLLLAGLVAIILAIFIFRKIRHDKASLSFGIYAFSGPGLWFMLLGIGLLAFHLGYEKVDYYLVMSGALLPIVFFFIYYSLLMNITNNNHKLSLIMGGLSAAILVPGAISLLMGNYTGPVVTDWGTVYPYSGWTKFLLIGPFLKCGYVLADMIPRIVSWVKNKRITNLYQVLLDFTLIMIAVIVIFQVSGWLEAGWNLFLFQIITLISILTTYVVYTGDEVRKKFQIN